MLLHIWINMPFLSKPSFCRLSSICCFWSMLFSTGPRLPLCRKNLNFEMVPFQSSLRWNMKWYEMHLFSSSSAAWKGCCGRCIWACNFQISSTKIWSHAPLRRTTYNIRQPFFTKSHLQYVSAMYPHDLEAADSKPDPIQWRFCGWVDQPGVHWSLRAIRLHDDRLLWKYRDEHRLDLQVASNGDSESLLVLRSP